MKYYDITQMTAQEVFDASVSHVIEQGEPSISDGGSCLYRSNKGNLACAAGVFLTDEQAIDMEGEYWTAFKNPSRGWHEELIDDLQSDHDNNIKSIAFVEKFKIEAKRTAERFNLEWNHERA